MSLKTCLCLVTIAGLVAVVPAPACTIFMSSRNGQALVGNNEDWFDPNSRVRFIPASAGSFGRAAFGFRIGAVQGGVNDQGLFIDAAATPEQKFTRDPNKQYAGDMLMDRILRECATVADARAFFTKYQAPHTRAQFLICDKTGDSAIFEVGRVIDKTGDFQAVSNFCQSSIPAGQITDKRYLLASKVLGDASSKGVEQIRNALIATHQETPCPTQYSNIYDLKAGTIVLYHFHDFTTAVTFDLKTELAKGDHSINLPSLFPEKAAFAADGRRFNHEMDRQRQDPKWNQQANGFAGWIMHGSDENQDGRLEPAECMKMLCLDPADVKTIFDTFDSDHDGKLSPAELTELVHAWHPMALLQNFAP